jgi:hypothetical protein
VAKKSKNKAEKQEQGADVAPKPRQKKAAPKKKTVPAIEPTAAKKAPSVASTREPTDEEIRTRAYFIAERRIQLSLAGDSDHDWIEARRQLIEEAGPARS